MILFDAEAAGNTFRIVLGEEPALNEYLHNLRTTDDWDFDSALGLTDGSDGTTTMRIFERDGSESNMCGNGARAAAMALETLDRPPHLRVGNNTIRVERVSEGRYRVPIHSVASEIRFALSLPDRPVPRTIFRHFSIAGEPHAVAFAKDIGDIPLEEWGRLVVPNANCTFASLTKAGDREIIRARTFERGVNRETASCGTGACAATAALYALTGVPRGRTVIQMNGHELVVHAHRHSPSLSLSLEGDATIKRKEAL